MMMMMMMIIILSKLLFCMIDLLIFSLKILGSQGRVDTMSETSSRVLWLLSFFVVCCGFNSLHLDIAGSLGIWGYGMMSFFRYWYRAQGLFDLQL